MDIVEFFEKVCDFQLLDSQKEFVRKVYDAAKNDKRIYYLPPRGSNRFSFEILQAVVILVVAHDKGLLNRDCINNYSIEKTFPELFPYVREESPEE